MQVKSIAECSKGEHSAILLTFIKQPFSIKTFVLSIFKWLLKTGILYHEFCFHGHGIVSVNPRYVDRNNKFLSGCSASTSIQFVQVMK